MLLGLPIYGKTLNGKINVDESIFEELLGTLLTKYDMRGQCIKHTWLKYLCSRMVLIEMSIEKQKIIKTRIYMMLLIGLFLFPDTLSHIVHIMYLHLLRNINKIRSSSWCFACILCLYKSLCKTIKVDPSSFVECVVLLQAWGSSRMSSFTPINRCNFRFPYVTN